MAGEFICQKPWQVTGHQHHEAMRTTAWPHAERLLYKILISLADVLVWTLTPGLQWHAPIAHECIVLTDWKDVSWQPYSLLYRFCGCRFACELSVYPRLPWFSRSVTHRPLMLASWCVIRIRIRILSQSTQTEVNEHVCLQRDVSFSQPAVTSLEGNCWEWPLYFSVIYTPSQSQVFAYSPPPP